MSLHDAVRNGHVSEVKTLIATGSNVNQIDKLKRTPLHMAAWAGNKEIMQVLIRANANTSDKATDAFTPLHFAAQSQFPEAVDCVRLLIKANKSLMHQRISKGNKSALHLAALKGNEAMILALIELGADLNATTSSGQTYLDLIKSEELKSSISKKVAELQSGKLEKDSDKVADSGVECVESAAASSYNVDSTVGIKRPRDEVQSDKEENS